MSKLRSINTSIWGDTWFEDLTPTQKLLFIYFITNERTNMLGVYEISIKKISFETGIPSSDIDKHLKKFENDKKIRYTENRVILLNYLKHQKFNGNMEKSAIDCYNNLPDSLKLPNYKEIERSSKGFGILSQGFGMVRKIEVEDESEYEDEKEDESTPCPFNFKNSLISLGVEKEVASDFMAVRKAKDGVNTQIAFSAIEREIEKSKLSANDCIKMAVENSWKGFKAQWAENQDNKQTAPETGRKLDWIE